MPHSLIESSQAQIDSIRKEINDLMIIKSRGAVIRSRARWECNADRPSKYFLNLEKKNFIQKTIYRLKTDKGQIITDPKLILKEQEDFYTKLYSTTGNVDVGYISNLEAPKITENQRKILDANISMEELKRALFNLACGKSPGCDGLPADFIRHFWPQLKGFLYCLYCEIVETQEFHLSARRGIISLLEKAGKDPLLLKCWRPLTLLNTDYKIYSKLLANRFQQVLDTIISNDQTVFVKGRYMAENIIKMMNLLEYCNQTRHSAVVLSIDFEKAFDKLEWQAAEEALRLFNVGESFIKLVRILYTNPLSTVMNNGFWGNWFSPTRGCRQGDPFSSLIFITTAEILGLKLKANVNIRGVTMGRYEQLNSQYADDTWLALEPSAENINAVIEELTNFSRYSGLTINFEKSVAYKLGPLRDTDAKFYTLKPMLWSDGPVKILGVYVHPNWNIMHELNYDDALKKIASILTKWSHRSLSLTGKITVINSLISSLLVNKFMAIPTPKMTFFNEYKRLITQFIWNNKIPRVRYNKLIQSYDRGGLKLVDLESKNYALKATWLVRWERKNRLDKIDWLYVNLPIKDQNIWLVNLNERDILKNIPGQLDMGRQILIAWSKINFKSEFSEEFHFTSPIWYNSLIRRADQPFMDRCLINSPIVYINDIWDKESNKFMEYSQILNNFGEVIPYLTYRSLISSIPFVWKSQIKELDLENKVTPTTLESLLDKKEPSKHCYWLIINSKFLYQDGCRSNWERDLDLAIDELKELWNSLYQETRSNTNAAKLRFLQYKILNRILTTNITRAKWDKNVSPFCAFCGAHKETMVHLLFDCAIVQNLWKALKKWLKYFFKIEIEWTKELVILNNYRGKNRKFTNTVILILKQYIYSAKCKQEIPKFSNFSSVLHYWYNIEKTAAWQSKRVTLFTKIWKKYESMC